MSSSTIAVISDIHAAVEEGAHDAALTLLERAIRRLNRFIKPDITVVLGDLVDRPSSGDALGRLRRIKAVLDQSTSPYLVIPGNCDPPAHQFYTVFDRPPPYIDYGRLRLVPFVDCFGRGVPVERPAHDIERIRAARAGHGGPLVTLQHVAVKPPGHPVSASSYANAGEIALACEEAEVLSIGGHYHRSAGVEREGKSAYLSVKGMKDAPFTFTVVRIDGADRIEVVEHQLQIPRSLGLVDVHTHSELAYCSKGMRMSLTPRLAELFGLAGVALTEHSGQLYFDRDIYWKGDFCEDGIATAAGRKERIQAFWAAADRERDPALWVGLEIDADFRGGLVVRPEDFRRAAIRIGAVHYLRELCKGKDADPEKVADEFMHVTAGVVRSGIDVLAHPFRVFRRAALSVPERLYEPVARLLAECGVAAEVNFHTNDPDPRFFSLCLRYGMKLAFGSDAHAPWEVGEFAPHLELLHLAGYDGDVRDILWTPPPDRIARRSDRDRSQ